MKTPWIIISVNTKWEPFPHTDYAEPPVCQSMVPIQAQQLCVVVVAVVDVVVAVMMVVDVVVAVMMVVHHQIYQVPHPLSISKPHFSI